MLIIVITGTPGVGKSTISAQLASKINANLISIGELVKKEKLYTKFDRERDTFVADMEGVAEKVRRVVAESSGDLVIEGHYAVEVVPLNKVSVVFALRRDPEELRSTLVKREYNEGKIRENIAAEILDVCLYDAVKRCGKDKVCEVDVTGRKAENVVSEMLQILDGNRKCRIGLVDWLGKLEAEGRLDEYLEEF